MPAGAREIFAEGIILPPVRWTPEVERLLLANVRTPEARRGDLAAQRAAVERGGEGLRALVARYGGEAVRAAARDLIEDAERRTRAAPAKGAPPGPRAADWLRGGGGGGGRLPIGGGGGIPDGRFPARF